MIAEAIIGGVTLVSLAAIWMADRVYKRVELSNVPPVDPAAQRLRIDERRRVLERMRKEALQDINSAYSQVREHSQLRVAQAETMLLELADDEVEQ